MSINQALAMAGQVSDRIPEWDELIGPASGVVELPNRLYWSGDPRFDVGDDRERLTLYTTLLGEGRRADIARWVNPQHLVADWPSVRRLTARNLISVWESRLPQLAAA
ncbi:hypothetical protein BJ973_000794 [Actinoplanes tereljensis]|uniref:Uncharacterized protein n=1 Tax=Paractinoplanes tereljensis TaxID=571912 RepID=A0A919TTS7_9ACTN|nr:hypothetical protein [Actinoplanes tereljensis]GIF22848.1 hypothetical protein Ate02nite_55780 [Actinoplanes tereljensis]